MSVFRPVHLLRTVAAIDAAILYLVFGLVGVLPLVLLTPPFQVPDEQQHFYRAYQLSEFGSRGIVQGNAAGAILPSSLPELADRFLGSRAIHDARPVRPTPLRDTLGALAVPLDPARREFVDFTGAAFYSPLPYLPQVAAIALGRALDLGPLGLLYAARLVNGLAALLVVAAALRVLPVGRMTLLVIGLLPMALFEFASASSDAAVISTAFLFTSIAARARFRGRWTGSEVAVACLAGMVFCSLKPVYAPLLVIGLPGALDRGRTAHVVAVHAVLLAVVMGATALWMVHSASSLVLPIKNTSLPRQLAGIIGNPVAFIRAILYTVREQGAYWARGAVGLLGWLTIRLPTVMYVLPVVALLASLLLPRPAAPRIGLAEAAWQALLLGSSALLVLVALYLYWTPVGSGMVEGVQGRYFLPLGGLAAVALCAVMPTAPFLQSSMLRLAVLLLVAAEVALTSIVVIRAYQVF